MVTERPPQRLFISSRGQSPTGSLFLSSTVHGRSGALWIVDQPMFWKVCLVALVLIGGSAIKVASPVILNEHPTSQFLATQGLLSSENQGRRPLVAIVMFCFFSGGVGDESRRYPLRTKIAIGATVVVMPHIAQFSRVST